MNVRASLGVVSLLAALGGLLWWRGVAPRASRATALSVASAEASTSLPLPLGADNPSITERAAWRRARVVSGTLDGAAKASFERGKDLFVRAFSAEEGLGPYFNERSCLGCHGIPSLLGHGPIERSARVYNTGVVQHGGKEELSSKFMPYEVLAGQPPFVMPPGFKVLGSRRPPSLRGLGWVEAIGADQILAQPHCDEPVVSSDRVCGFALRRAIGPGTVRFGVKMSVATLEEFIAGALSLEMGLLTEFPIAPTDPPVTHAELATTAVIDLASFIAFSPPPVAPATPDPEGLQVFEAAGCKDCHWSRFQVDGRPAPQMYTDMLAHYMGASRAEAGYDHLMPPGHYRTTPLWGLREQQGPYLHDGAAPGLDEAIGMHSGEASSAQARYRALDDTSRQHLLRMLAGL
jgi:CxxC motif-containing protein (DUF1111 family)